MTCPICNTETSTVFQKSGIGYDICPNCQCCFTLDEFTPVTHNQGSEARNEDVVNKVRLERILEHSVSNPLVLDFGCGQGQFGELLSIRGISVTEVDTDTDMQIDYFNNEMLDVINCVEVIEHIVRPKEIVEEFHRVLKPGGIVYLESSFTDFLGNPTNAGYIDPNIGHVLVHSRKSIEMLFGKFEAKWLNSNVVVFKKK